MDAHSSIAASATHRNLESSTGSRGSNYSRWLEGKEIVEVEREGEGRGGQGRAVTQLEGSSEGMFEVSRRDMSSVEDDAARI